MEKTDYIVDVAVRGASGGYKQYRLKADEAKLRSVPSGAEVLTLYTDEEMIAQFVNPLGWYNLTRQQD